jgi:hypothetical protein
MSYFSCCYALIFDFICTFSNTFSFFSLSLMLPLVAYPGFSRWPGGALHGL